MMDEDSGGLGFSGDELDSFSHDSREEQNTSYKNSAFCTEEYKDCLDDRYAPMCLPMSDCSCNVDRKPRASEKEKPHTQKKLCFVSDPCYAWASSNEMLNLLPRQQWRLNRRLHQKEEAVIKIQSAWRGWQVRKKFDEMNRAAIQIQAAFRGYVTRKELPLGLCSALQIERPPSKKKSSKIKSRSLASLDRAHRSDMATVAQTESQSMYFPNNRLKIYPRHITENFPVLHPNVPFFYMNSPIRPNREVFAYTSLNVLSSRVLKQKYQDAATTIQAAWRKYQRRQKGKPSIHTVKSLKDFPSERCGDHQPGPLNSLMEHGPAPEFKGLATPALEGSSNVIINQTSWKREWAGRTVEQHEIQQIIAKSILREVPQIRNINIYTVVKGTSASSQKPDIAIKVQGTKSVVQGFQRDMRRGAQAFYTVKTRHASRPSQILIHVNLQKGKEEMQKPE